MLSLCLALAIMHNLSFLLPDSAISTLLLCQQAPSLCCLSAVLQSTESPRSFYTSLYTDLCTYHPGNVPWLPSSEGQGGLHSWVLWKQSFVGYHLWALHKQTEKYLWAFCERGLFAGPGFDLRGKLLVWHICRGLRKHSQGTKASGHHLCALPLPHSSSPVSSRKEIIPLSGALIFADCRGDLYVAWLSRPVELTLMGPTGL